MKYYSQSMAPILKSDKLNEKQCLNNYFEGQMKNIPYAFIVGSLMYVHVAEDLLFICCGNVGMKNNPSLDQWKAANKVMRYRDQRLHVFYIDGSKNWN